VEEVNSKVSKGEPSRHMWKKSPRRPPHSYPMISIPDYCIYTEFLKNLIGSLGFGNYSLAFG